MWLSLVAPVLAEVSVRRREPEHREPVLPEAERVARRLAHLLYRRLQRRLSLLHRQSILVCMYTSSTVKRRIPRRHRPRPQREALEDSVRRPLADLVPHLFPLLQPLQPRAAAGGGNR